MLQEFVFWTETLQQWAWNTSSIRSTTYPKPDSFDRLLAVVEHPPTSQYVTSLFYEADLLTSRSVPQDDRQVWEKNIVGPEDAGPLEEFQNPHFTSACDLLPKRFVRGSSVYISARQHHYTKREVQQAYEKYRSNRAEQRRMNESAAYEEAMVIAMKQLPHLKSLIMSCNRGNTSHFRAAFEAGLSQDVTPDPRTNHQVGALQLSSLLSAVDQAGLRITKLVCGSLGQLFRNYSLDRRDAMARSIRNLRSLHLFLSHIPEASDPNAASNPLGTYISPSSFATFLTHAADLGTLSIRSNEDRPLDPPDLEHIVTDFHRSCLASVTFAKMCTGPDTLIGFCDRHAVSLKDLILMDISLHNGRWASTFLKMELRARNNRNQTNSYVLHTSHR